MCVQHGNGHTKNFTDCEMGKLYKVRKIMIDKYCIPANTNIWYVMEGDDMLYASTLFEEITRRQYEFIKFYYKFENV